MVPMESNSCSRQWSGKYRDQPNCCMSPMGATHCDLHSSRLCCSRVDGRIGFTYWTDSWYRAVPQRLPVPTILHISDLHRTSHPHLDNDELLSSICSDASRWHADGIPSPDLIVVSGDIVQGAAINDPNADAVVKSQYDEATDLLFRLTDEFLGSDRSRVVIVPGNHDVHWGRSKQAMEILGDGPIDIAGLAFVPTSDIRWCWAEQRAYKITNRSVYDSRLQLFKEFLDTFYHDVHPNPIIDAHAYLFSAEYTDLDLSIVGLPSWSGNDCFCHVGHINSATLAAAQQIVANSQASVTVAVWHHGIVGSPNTMDYMDQRVVHKLIDYGFQVGLHGHQHYPGAAPFALNLPNRTSIVLVGAGSLAVGDRELPMGEHRQFNVVQIDQQDKTVTVHIRAMSSSGVFAGSFRDDFGGNTFITLPLPPSKSASSGKVPRTIALADEVVTALGEQRYHDAIDLASRLTDSQADFRRKAKISAFEALEDYDHVIAMLDPPQRTDEALKLIALLIKLHRWDSAEDQLNTLSGTIPKAVTTDFRERIAAGRLLP